MLYSSNFISNTHKVRIPFIPLFTISLTPSKELLLLSIMYVLLHIPTNCYFYMIKLLCKKYYQMCVCVCVCVICYFFLAYTSGFFS